MRLALFQMPQVKRIICPPLWLLFALLIMAALNHFAPARRWPPFPWNLLGLLPLIAGLTLGASGATLFRRRGTGVKPFSPATTLVINGPYRYTRNPMYLGLTTTLIGVAILLGSLTPLIVPFAFAVLIHFRYIRHEEAFMTERFGGEYLQYKSRVRRWI